MLTKKQWDLLRLIHGYIQKNGWAPSYEEMKRHLGLRSKSGVHGLVLSLEERGFIRRLPYRARAIEILKLPTELEELPSAAHAHAQPGEPPGEHPREHKAHAQVVPLVGRIAAGVPIEALSQVEDHITVPAQMLSPRLHHYALKITGESMIEAGINHGDIGIIAQVNTAQNGDIIVALIETHEATLKRYRLRGKMVELAAANPAFEDRRYHADSVAIQGKLVGLIRVY